MATLTREQVLDIIAKAPPGTSAAGVVAALRQQGHTLEGYAARAPQIVRTIPVGKRIARHALAGFPAVGATAGGILGGAATKSPGGIAWGAAGGGAAGRVAEQLGALALGYPSPRSLTEQMVNVPGPLRQPVDVAEQGAFAGLLEGALPWTSAGLRRFANWRTGVTGKHAVGRAMKIIREGNVEKETLEELAKAKAAREAAGAEKGATLEAAGEISLNDLAEHVMNQQKQSFGTSVPKQRILTAIRKRRADVLAKHTGGARAGRELVEDLRSADLTKQAFARGLRGEFSGGERGLTPMPGLDRQIHAAYKELLEARTPGLPEANVKASAAIREHQDVAKAAKSIRSGSVKELKALADAKRAYAAATTPGPGFHLGLSGGLTTMPRFYPHVGSIGDAARSISEFLQNPAVRYSPSATNLLVRLLMSQTPAAPEGEQQ